MYSLGNFTFGTPGRFRKVDKIHHYGLIADIVISGKKIAYIDLTAIKTNNKAIHYQPEVEDPEQLDKIMNFLNRSFNTPYEMKNNKARIYLPIRTGFNHTVRQLSRCGS